VSDIKLHARSGLEHLNATGSRGADTAQPGVTLMLRPDVALAAVMARKRSTQALADAVRRAFALNLPRAPRRVASGAVSFIWAGPGKWLATSDDMVGYEFESRLRQQLAGSASVTDQSDVRIVLRIHGPRAREALAKMLPIDLHPRAFGSGDAALTAAASIGVHIWQLDDTPSYEAAVFRSYAGSLWHWLIASAEEFGVAVIVER
jgi:methylglutamate dehydrogenase subunit D